jgi:steroid delta-isomerase-like uncharacterized protein
MANPKELTRQAIDFFNQGKLDEWLKVVADDAVVVSPLGGTIKGKEAIKAFFAQTLKSFPDAKVNIQQLVAEGNVVAMEYVFTGTNTGPTTLPTGEQVPPTNRRITSPSVDIATFDGSGRLKSLRQYFDMAGAMQQLGMAPAPATARS